MSNLLKKEKGFTLIEIVLVLAIAGLLLVIVFLAVSGAQKSRRDSQRKTDNARILAQMESFASNNAGNYPANATQQGAFKTTYINGILSPDAAAYNVNFSTATIPTTNPTLVKDTVTIYINGRTVETCMGLEQGTACVNNK